MVGLRSALDGTWFTSVRAIADSLLADQVQQQWRIRGDRLPFTEVGLLKGANGMARPIEAQLVWYEVATPGRFGHDAADQIISQ